MNFTLLRTQRALRFVPFAAGLAAVTLWTFVSSEHDVPVVREVDSSPGALYATLHEWIWFALAIVAPAVFPGVRIANYERALPVRSVIALGARMIAFALVLAAPITVSLVLHAIYRPELLDVASLAIVVPTWLVVIGTTTMWVFVGFPSRSELGGWRQVLVGGVGAVLLMLPTYVFFPWIALPYAVFAGILVQRFSRPTSYLHGSHESLNALAAIERTSAPLFGIDTVRWTLMRSTFLRPYVVLMLVMMTCLPWMLSTSHSTGNLFIIPFVLAGLVNIGLQSLRGFDALPIRRRQVLRYIALPPLYALVFGCALSYFWPSSYMFYVPLDDGVRLEYGRERTLRSEDRRTMTILLPPEHWVVTTSELRVESPWGEAHEPILHPILPGASICVGNPFSVGEGSSVRFLAWQLSRAFEAVYGLRLGTDEVHARWLSEFELDALVDSIPSNHFRESASLIRIGDPLQTPGRDLGFLALLSVVAWFGVMLVVLRNNVPGFTRAAWLRQRVCEYGALALALVLWFGVMHFNIEDPALLPVLLASLRGAIDGLVGGSVIGWIVLVVAAVLGCLAILGWRIERIETPKQRLWGWTRKPMSAF